MKAGARHVADDDAGWVLLPPREVIPFKNACPGPFLAHHGANRFAYDARDFNSQGLMAGLMTKLDARLEDSVGSRP